MKTLLTGDCHNENVFQLIDPAEFSEAQFEAETIKALCCLYQDYFCGPFRGSFDLDGETRVADLALIHKSFTHWFVIEVELISHSLDKHVLPQIRCFRFGEASESCITSFCNGFAGLDRNRAESLLRFVPRSIAVVVNRYEREWELSLKALDTQLITLSIFRERSGRTAHEIQGFLHVVRESLGFAQYSSIDRSFRLPISSDIPRGSIQIEDPFGALSAWVVRESNGYLWVTKEVGDPALPHNKHLQVLRAYDGRITLKLPGV